MIFVYGDDSADERKQRVSAVAVVVGDEEGWQALESKWIERTNGIPFHARDCESDRGDYANISHDDNKSLYRALTTMLAESDLGGFGVAVDLVAQRQIFPESLDLAYYKAFLDVVQSAKNLAVHFNQIAKLTFDISTENEYNARLLYNNLREGEPNWAKHLYREISFGSAKECARLQVADLMAFEAMKALDHTVGPEKRRRASWDALRATERFDTHSYSSDWFNDLKRNYGELERKVGFCKQDYANWLKERNRQHSISNLFHFMNWIGKRSV